MKVDLVNALQVRMRSTRFAFASRSRTSTSTETWGTHTRPRTRLHSQAFQIAQGWMRGWMEDGWMAGWHILLNLDAVRPDVAPQWAAFIGESTAD